jgi:hypothetical protein
MKKIHLRSESRYQAGPSPRSQRDRNAVRVSGEILIELCFVEDKCRPQCVLEFGLHEWDGPHGRTALKCESFLDHREKFQQTLWMTVFALGRETVLTRTPADVDAGVSGFLL